MPWLETDVRDQRIQFVKAVREPGAKMARVCRAFRISRKTGYKWLGRETAAHSAMALADRSRRPLTSSQRTAAVVTGRVRVLRAEYGWGGDKLAMLLEAEGIVLAPRTIDRIIQREGLTRLDSAPAPALGRFERAAPNELWQMDAKGCYPLRPHGQCHPLSILDDHSRYAIGLVALPRLTTRGVRAALIGCFERVGVPAAMLMDHGVPWWNASNATGLTTLSVFLLNQGIHLLFGRVRHPQTQGKVERFHRTLGERLRWWGVPTTLPEFTRAFATFRDEYNEVRPHEALQMRPPASRFAPSGRAYAPTPPRWDYPAGSDVRHVAANGRLWYGSHQFFISEALAGAQVACTPFARRVLVRYRHMFVRELHPRTGRSVSLLRATQ